jgi:hypothetical protein
MTSALQKRFTLRSFVCFHVLSGHISQTFQKFDKLIPTFHFTRIEGNRSAQNFWSAQNFVLFGAAVNPAATGSTRLFFASTEDEKRLPEMFLGRRRRTWGIFAVQGEIFRRRPTGRGGVGATR